MASDGQLRGKIALVTGGSRGIGKQIALVLAQHGADIALNYRSHEVEADRTMSEVQEYGVRCIRVRADVSKVSEVTRMIDMVRDKIGSVQILINNAWIAKPQTLKEINEKDWDETIETNLKSAFLVSRN